MLMLSVGGFVPFTSTDYPGHLSTVIFCQGCPWRCGYCHNPHLQPFINNQKILWQTIIDFLVQRKGLLDAVVFSGGEPTLNPFLIPAIREVKSLGYKIGLHSAGISHKRLSQTLPLIDWVGLDIKAPFEMYDQITQKKHSGYNARLCVQAIIESGVSYEFRTTVHRSLLKKEHLIQIAETIYFMGANSYVLQPFQPHGCNNEQLKQESQQPHIDKYLQKELTMRFSSRLQISYRI